MSGNQGIENTIAKSLAELNCKIRSLINSITSTKTIDGLLCDNTLSVVQVSKTVQTVPHPDYVQKVQLCPSTKKDPEVVCISNDNGETVVSGWEVFTISETDVVTSNIYLNGVDVTGVYKVVPCGIKVKYDYEITEVCVDGKQWTKVYVYDPSSVIPTLVSILWLDQTDLPVSAPDPSLINNVNCKVCLPTVSDAFGNDLSTLLPGTSFVITKSDCCKIEITTSVGKITLREKETYYATTDFNCAVTVTGINIISGKCNLSDIHIISNFKG